MFCLCGKYSAFFPPASNAPLSSREISYFREGNRGPAVMRESYDVIIVGGGHAGCEAACASARLGANTLLVTMDMTRVGQMSCNPAIGGIAKGQIVREIDALGGHTGEVTDRTAIQARMLNRGKGPAMWSPRAQCDRARFTLEWRRTLDKETNLHIWQDQVSELVASGGEVQGVVTCLGLRLRARCVVVCAGTFLNGLMHVGRVKLPGGRAAEPASLRLSESIEALGITRGRMKTGTPVRIDGRSVHFEDMTRQDGEEDFAGFSFMGLTDKLPGLPCWTTQTNPDVHARLREGLDDSPLFNGQIQSKGPRYCPSIETKLVTFADRDHHLLFLEPEGVDTAEYYLNGFSSSLPTDIQISALRHIPAFRDVVAYRPGYAIEYDMFDPTQLNPSLESKKVGGLFMAGQVNGTTGYEEAAGQGLVAGVNAALRCSGGEPLVMGRDESYIGVLIDDLVTKGVDEPYRMFTSRAEYRTLLRQDNADERLTERGYALGLATRERMDRWTEKREAMGRLRELCERLTVRPEQVQPALEAVGSAALEKACKLSALVRRPDVSIGKLSPLVPELGDLMEGLGKRGAEIAEAVEIGIKYGGYIERETQLAEKAKRLEGMRIRGRIDYGKVKGISTEGRQKLAQIDPDTIGQASRIPGVSPSDISVLLVMMGR